MAPRGAGRLVTWEVWRHAERRGAAWRLVGRWSDEERARARYSRELARLRAGSIALVDAGDLTLEECRSVSWRPRGARQGNILALVTAPWLRARW